MTSDIRAFFDQATSTVTYLVIDATTKRAAIIDPVLDFDAAAARVSTGSADAVLAAVREAGAVIDWVLETHAHADHLSAAHYIRGKTGASVAIGAKITQV